MMRWEVTMLRAVKQSTGLRGFLWCLAPIIITASTPSSASYLGAHQAVRWMLYS